MSAHDHDEPFTDVAPDLQLDDDLDYPDDLPVGLDLDPFDEHGAPDEPFVPEDLPDVLGEATLEERESVRGRTNAVTSVDIAAEEAIIGALFADPALIDDLNGRIAGSDFGVLKHECVFDAIAAVDAQRSAIDQVTVAAELERAGNLRKVGGVAGVEALATMGQKDPVQAKEKASAAVASFNDYVDIVFDRATRRRMMMSARKIIEAAGDQTTSASTVVETAESLVFAVSTSRTTATERPMADVMADVANRMALARSKKLIGVSSGFKKLDELTGGFQPGQMITIAARPAMGKSVLVTQMCEQIASDTGDIVVFFSYEMQGGEIGLRMLAAHSGVHLSQLMRGHVPREMEGDVARYSAQLAASSMLIDDRPPPTIAGVRSALRRISRRGRIAAVGLDYLQLVGGDNLRRDSTRENEVSQVTRIIKMMGDEFGAPMLACSQLNRGLESRPDKRPMLSDLRESGSIEQDSSLVIFPYRHSVYDPTHPASDAELIVAKNRNGATDTIYVDWDGPCTRFKDSERTGPYGGFADMGGDQGPGGQGAPAGLPAGVGFNGAQHGWDGPGAGFPTGNALPGWS